MNTRAWRAAEIPAANGHGTARGLARIYGALARDGELDGVQVLSPAQIERANTEQSFGKDEVLAPLHTRFGLGFFMTQPMIPFGPNPRSFGHPGAGGSIAFADPDARARHRLRDEPDAGRAGRRRARLPADRGGLRGAEVTPARAARDV